MHPLWVYMFMAVFMAISQSEVIEMVWKYGDTRLHYAYVGDTLNFTWFYNDTVNTVRIVYDRYQYVLCEDLHIGSRIYTQDPAYVPVEKIGTMFAVSTVRIDCILGMKAEIRVLPAGVAPPKHWKFGYFPFHHTQDVVQWYRGAEALFPIHKETGDTLQFTWSSGDHNVVFANANQFHTCENIDNFHEFEIHSTSPATLVMPERGGEYYAISTIYPDCAEGYKVRLIVKPRNYKYAPAYVDGYPNLEYLDVNPPFVRDPFVDWTPNAPAYGDFWDDPSSIDPDHFNDKLFMHAFNRSYFDPTFTPPPIKTDTLEEQLAPPGPGDYFAHIPFTGNVDDEFFEIEPSFVDGKFVPGTTRRPKIRCGNRTFITRNGTFEMGRFNFSIGNHRLLTKEGTALETTTLYGIGNYVMGTSNDNTALLCVTDELIVQSEVNCGNLTLLAKNGIIEMRNIKFVIKNNTQSTNSAFVIGTSNSTAILVCQKGSPSINSEIRCGNITFTTRNGTYEKGKYTFVNENYNQPDDNTFVMGISKDTAILLCEKNVLIVQSKVKCGDVTYIARNDIIETMDYAFTIKNIIRTEENTFIIGTSKDTITAYLLCENGAPLITSEIYCGDVKFIVRNDTIETGNINYVVGNNTQIGNNTLFVMGMSKDATTSLLCENGTPIITSEIYCGDVKFAVRNDTIQTGNITFVVGSNTWAGNNTLLLGKSKDATAALLCENYTPLIILEINCGESIFIARNGIIEIANTMFVVESDGPQSDILVIATSEDTILLCESNIPLIQSVIDCEGFTFVTIGTFEMGNTALAHREGTSATSKTLHNTRKLCETDSLIVPSGSGSGMNIVLQKSFEIPSTYRQISMGHSIHSMKDNAETFDTSVDAIFFPHFEIRFQNRCISHKFFTVKNQACNGNEYLLWESTDGMLRSPITGKCAGVERARDWVSVRMFTCETGNIHQKWSFNNGRIENGIRGYCLVHSSNLIMKLHPCGIKEDDIYRIFINNIEVKEPDNVFHSYIPNNTVPSLYSVQKSSKLYKIKVGNECLIHELHHMRNGICTGSVSEIWDTSGGVLRSPITGKCADIHKARSWMSVVMSECVENRLNQQWILEPGRIESALSGFCLAPLFSSIVRIAPCYLRKNMEYSFESYLEEL